MVISSQEQSYEVVQVLAPEEDVLHYLGRDRDGIHVHLISMGRGEEIKGFLAFLSEMEENAAFTDLREYFLEDGILWMVFSWNKGQPLEVYLKEAHPGAERFDLARRIMEQVILKMIPVCLQREVLSPDRVLVGEDGQPGFYYSFGGWREYGAADMDSSVPALCSLLKAVFQAEEESGLYPEWEQWAAALSSGRWGSILDIYQEYVKLAPVFAAERTKEKKPGLKERWKKRLPRILAAVKIAAGITVLAAAFVGAAGMWKEKVAPVIEAASLWKAVYVDGETLEPETEEPAVEETKPETEPEQDPDNGRGERYREDGSLCYKGGLKDGLYDDTGTLYYQDGTVAYQGSFAFGKKEGEGCQYTDNGNIFYEGDFKKDQFEGTGKLYDADTGNLVYEGGFSGGRYSGDGVLYDGTTEFPVYTGSFRLGKYDGRGLEYDSAGSLLYEGEFLLGRYHGEGLLYDTATGEVLLDGVFRNGIYIGAKAADGEDKAADSGMVDADGQAASKDGQDENRDGAAGAADEGAAADAQPAAADTQVAAGDTQSTAADVQPVAADTQSANENSSSASPGSYGPGVTQVPDRETEKPMEIGPGVQ